MNIVSSQGINFLTQEALRGAQSSGSWRGAALKIVLIVGAIIGAVIFAVRYLMSRAALPPRLQATPINPAPLEEPSTKQILQSSSFLFLKQAVCNELFRLDAPTKALYEDMIKNDGEPEEGDPVVDIFHWSAKCVLVHYLRKQGFCPYADFPLASHATAASDLWGAYRKLNRSEQALCLLHATNAPLQTYKLSQRAKQVSDQINAYAFKIVRDKAFIDLYARLPSEIDNY